MRRLFAAAVLVITVCPFTGGIVGFPTICSISQARV